MILSHQVMKAVKLALQTHFTVPCYNGKTPDEKLYPQILWLVHDSRPVPSPAFTSDYEEIPVEFQVRGTNSPKVVMSLCEKLQRVFDRKTFSFSSAACGEESMCSLVIDSSFASESTSGEARWLGTVLVAWRAKRPITPASCWLQLSTSSETSETT